MTFAIRDISVAPVEGGGFEVRLNGKALLTPSRAPMRLPARELAEAIADEWRTQKGEVKPATMPMMQLAATALDRIAPQRPAIVDAVAKYAETDLLCYRAEGPPALVERQARVWQPLLDWAALQYDAPLHVQAGIMPRPQPPEALKALRAAVEALDDFQLTMLQFACGAMGSLLLALALLEGRIDPTEAFEAAELDATFQIEQWGEDAEATRRRASLMADIQSARRFLDLLEGRKSA